MTDPLLSDARALAHRLGLIEPGPHGENALKESAVRAIQAFALRQRAAAFLSASQQIWAGLDVYEPIDDREAVQRMFCESYRRVATHLEARAKEIEG